MKKSYKKLFLAIFFVAITSISYARPDPAPPPPPVGIVPIDGGLLSLIIAGSFYGVIKLLRKKS